MKIIFGIAILCLALGSCLGPPRGPVVREEALASFRCNETELDTCLAVLRRAPDEDHTNPNQHCRCMTWQRVPLDSGRVVDVTLGFSANGRVWLIQWGERPMSGSPLSKMTFKSG